MKERPILFNGEMVRAILEDRKTQTRREITPQFSIVHAIYPDSSILTNRIFRGDDQTIHCPFGTVGDRLWVRETFYNDIPEEKTLEHVYYRADGECCEQIPECQCASVGKTKWIPSIHMPRWASRITLEITDIRVQRLKDISEEDAWAEGCKRGLPTDNGGFFPAEEPDPSGVGHRGWDCAVDWYTDLWESINGEGSWDNNPWVWVISFRVAEILNHS